MVASPGFLVVSPLIDNGSMVVISVTVSVCDGELPTNKLLIVLVMIVVVCRVGVLPSVIATSLFFTHDFVILVSVVAVAGGNVVTSSRWNSVTVFDLSVVVVSTVLPNNPIC